jgi:putative acetyltransferase
MNTATPRGSGLSDRTTDRLSAIIVFQSGFEFKTSEATAVRVMRLEEQQFMNAIIRTESPEDRTAIWQVNRLAFGREDEPRLVDELRDEGYARVSLVAELAGQIVGHVLFSHLPIMSASGIVNALSLAPMAVVPSEQQKGIGSTLVTEGLRACREAGHRIVVVLGHPDFYPRFGFSANLAARLKSPYNGPSFMALELVPGALDGIDGEVRYPPPFERL